ncbi:MAG: helix-turn-helix transcriptional regulator [Anaerolineales bacterium]|nr:helix-turn-helix transcriptional regulator [Anaerolineales bacterium]
MKVGSKYHPLYLVLSTSGQEEISLSLKEIETLLGHPLPLSAYQNKGWWSNRATQVSQASAWMDAGYHVTHIDLNHQRITFRKPVFNYEIRRAGDTVLWNAEMIRALRHHMNASQGELAEELGVRQQTISEWEKEIYTPKKAMSKLLGFVAERAGFKYET